MRWLDSITDSMDMNLDQETVENRRGWHATVHGVAESQTQLSDWITMIFVFLCHSLTSLMMIISRSIHVAANGIISFFSVAKYYSIVYMYHSFFIHSSVSGRLGCFHVLAIINSVAVNIGVTASFEIVVFSAYMPRSGLFIFG